MASDRLPASRPYDRRTLAVEHQSEAFIGLTVAQTKSNPETRF